MIRTTKHSIMCFFSAIKLKPRINRTNNLIKEDTEAFHLCLKRTRIGNLIGCTYLQPWVRKNCLNFDLYRQPYILNNENGKDLWKHYSDYFNLTMES